MNKTSFIKILCPECKGTYTLALCDEGETDWNRHTGYCIHCGVLNYYLICEVDSDGGYLIPAPLVDQDVSVNHSRDSVLIAICASIGIIALIIALVLGTLKAFELIN